MFLSPGRKLATLREERAETFHEREILLGSSLDDLDQDLVREFIRQAGLPEDPGKNPLSSLWPD